VDATVQKPPKRHGYFITINAIIIDADRVKITMYMRGETLSSRSFTKSITPLVPIFLASRIALYSPHTVSKTFEVISAYKIAKVGIHAQVMMASILSSKYIFERYSQRYQVQEIAAEKNRGIVNRIIDFIVNSKNLSKPLRRFGCLMSCL
jgi:hypothetical protein